MSAKELDESPIIIASQIINPHQIVYDERSKGTRNKKDLLSNAYNETNYSPKFANQVSELNNIPPSQTLGGINSILQYDNIPASMSSEGGLKVSYHQEDTNEDLVELTNQITGTKMEILKRKSKSKKKIHKIECA